MSQTRERLNFMVVDDSPTALTLLLMAIKMARVQDVTIKAEGFQSPILALEDFSTKPDLRDAIFTDFNMPGLNGVEFSLKIRKIRPEIPLYICTSEPESCMKYLEDNKVNPPITVFNKYGVEKPIELAIQGLLNARKKNFETT